MQAGLGELITVGADVDGVLETQGVDAVNIQNIKKRCRAHCELDTTPVLDFLSSGGPFGTVPELFFEKKQPIPVLQQLLLYHSQPTT